MTMHTPLSTLTQVTLQQRGELPVLQISNRHADASIALQGAQLLDYTPHGAKPVVWLSEQADYQRGQSVRGGIPICWPWFGAIERNPDTVRAMTRGENLPAHGLVRTRDWTLQSVQENDTFTQIRLGLVTDSALHSIWPHAAELQLVVTVGSSLKIELTSHNIGVQPIELTQALHTYLSASSIETVELTGLERSRYIETLDKWQELPQTGSIRFSGETDRIYLDVPGTLKLHDSGWKRTITLQASGSRSAIVWNPWIEKAKRLSQFSPGAWRNMLCIETANVLEDAITLAPHASHKMQLEISCSPLHDQASE